MSSPLLVASVAAVLGVLVVVVIVKRRRAVAPMTNETNLLWDDLAKLLANGDYVETSGHFLAAETAATQTVHGSESGIMMPHEVETKLVDPRAVQESEEEGGMIL
jgi:hypothetical protein